MLNTIHLKLFGIYQIPILRYVAGIPLLPFLHALYLCRGWPQEELATNPDDIWLYDPTQDRTPR